jgi:hypothetical protein
VRELRSADLPTVHRSSHLHNRRGRTLATCRAIEATCQGVVELLRADQPDDLSAEPLQITVVTRDELVASQPAGVTLFLYRISYEDAIRTPEPHRLPDGRPKVPRLLVQLHFLLTSRGPTASLQHLLAGWMVGVMANHPVLPPDLLNRRYAGAPVFAPDETVELAPAALAAEELHRLWNSIGPGTYQLSVPYLARGFNIEPTRALDRQLPILESQR